MANVGVAIPSARHRGRAPSKEMLAEGEKTSAWLLATKGTESRRDIAPRGSVSHYPGRLGREQRLQPEGFRLAFRKEARRSANILSNPGLRKELQGPPGPYQPLQT